MNSDILKILKDRRVQLGMAAAAVLGLIVLFRRGTNGDVSAGDGQSVNTGTLDSTGTDSYNAISQIGQAWQDSWNDQFGQFSDQLTGIQDQLGQLQKPVTPATPAPWPRYRPINTSLPKGTGWIQVHRGDTLASIAARYGKTTDALRQYNTARALNRLTVGEWIRVRSNAGPNPN